ncbi:hypothetical protein [Bifidobacterium longum]|uniref:hypothetical protein n=1 Tax=Bifidobacterium longum TaxID=216816 RepID=UPI0012FEDAB4|nr:hypothetical protein [Bifidobacterium longum]MBH8620113.1 hypothetical protein [Bifidobacterium longum subsp. longum]MDB6731847.1 hypothetical protein [Bifidobacterium longum]MDB6737267.1 hypothetical protein [Bifidobacterium longum]MDB6739170.1 hypothetical protein [Bifidobacterium longum]MDL5499699.1 hypothetical protein [Bifidobacterium longum]
MKTMSLWGGLDAFRIAVFDGRARGGEQVIHAFPVRIHHGRRSGLAIVDGNALLGGERLELGVIEQADFLAAQVAGDAHLFGRFGRCWLRLPPHQRAADHAHYRKQGDQSDDF